MSLDTDIEFLQRNTIAADGEHAAVKESWRNVRYGVEQLRAAIATASGPMVERANVAMAEDTQRLRAEVERLRETVLLLAEFGLDAGQWGTVRERHPGLLEEKSGE